MTAIYDALMRRDTRTPLTTIVPDLAYAWNSSNNFKTYTINLSLVGVESRVAYLDGQIEDIDVRLQRLYDIKSVKVKNAEIALETGKLELDDLAPRIKELRVKRDLVLRARSEARETLDAGRVEQVNRGVVLEYLKNLKGVLDQGTVGEKRAFLTSFIKSVDVEDSQVTVRYSLPLPAETEAIESARVLNTVQTGGAGGTRTPDFLLAKEALSRTELQPHECVHGMALDYRSG